MHTPVCRCCPTISLNHVIKKKKKKISIFYFEPSHIFVVYSIPKIKLKIVTGPYVDVNQLIAEGIYEMYYSTSQKSTNTF